MTRRPLAALLATLLLGVVACSGGDDDGGGGGEPAPDVAPAAAAAALATALAAGDLAGAPLTAATAGTAATAYDAVVEDMGDLTPTVVADNAALLALFEHEYARGRAALLAADVAAFQQPFILRSGDTIHARMTRYEMVRVALAQTIHHRAQLGVYLRLNGIALPQSYGPTADDAGFMA